MTGSTPYPDILSARGVEEFIQKGCRMAKPHHCSDAMLVGLHSDFIKIPIIIY